MAKIISNEEYVIISSGNKIAAHNIRHSNTRHFLQFPAVVAAKKQPESSGTKVKEKPLMKDAGILYLLACKCGNHLAACNDNKQLLIWKVGEDFEVIYTRNLPRKALCMAFVQDCRYILVADKTGDVIRFDTQYEDKCENGELLLGHLSIILDIIVSPEEEFVITCDRDEKIRVSCYPNCYNIYSYCLGHSEFVIKLAILPKLPNILASGSGDGTLRFWELQTGKEIGRTHCLEHISEVHLAKLKEVDESFNDRNLTHNEKETNLAIKKLICNSSSTIAVIYHRLPLIGLYTYTSECSPVMQRINCCHIENMTLPSDPSDICFDAENRLWVLSQSKEWFVQVYRFEDDKCVLYGDNDSNLSHVIKKLNADSEFFKDSLDVPSIIPPLYKQWYDNVTRYLCSKEEKRQKKNAKKHPKQSTFTNQNKKQRIV